jgi:hypothetical protein
MPEWLGPMKISPYCGQEFIPADFFLAVATCGSKNGVSFLLCLFLSIGRVLGYAPREQAFEMFR